MMRGSRPVDDIEDDMYEDDDTQYSQAVIRDEVRDRANTSDGR
jgi:hypothetical protein